MNFFAYRTWVYTKGLDVTFRCTVSPPNRQRFDATCKQTKQWLETFLSNLFHIQCWTKFLLANRYPLFVYKPTEIHPIHQYSIFTANRACMEITSHIKQNSGNSRCYSSTIKISREIRRIDFLLSYRYKLPTLLTRNFNENVNPLPTFFSTAPAAVINVKNMRTRMQRHWAQL